MIFSQKKSWVYVCFWVILTYSTLSVVRPLSEYLREIMPVGIAINTLIGALLLIFAILIYKQKAQSLIRWALLFTIIASYTYGLWVIKIPEERVHFVQYGVLTFLLLKALRFNLRGWKLYLTAITIGGLIGLGDEGIQHILPRRYFQWVDVRLNVVSCTLAAALVAVWCEKTENRRSP